MGRGRTELDTLLVGIDAACAEILDPLRADGQIPNLRSLFEQGVSGGLESQIPPWTASAWPSMYTGVNPGKHGVFGFLTFDGYDWSVVNRTHVRRRSVWQLLDYHDFSSVIVNVPVTHPPSPIDGAIVPGYVAPEHPDCHPEGVLEDVREAIGGYRVYAPDSASGDELVEWYRRLTRMRSEAFQYLVDRFRPDFGFIQFQQTDTVFHEMPGDREAIREIYRTVDTEVGALLDEVDPDTVFVVSDHGMGTYDGWKFHVNDFLQESGFVVPTRGGEGMPTWVTARNEQLYEGETATEPRERTLDRFAALAATVGLTTERVGSILDYVGLREFAADHVPVSAIMAGMEQVDFPSSRAYLREPHELGIHINLEGREPDGIVPASEYETVRDTLIDELSSVRTPEDEPVFEDVARREKYFHGPAANDAVDVVTVPNEFENTLSGKLADTQFHSLDGEYNHKRNGIVAAHGRGIDTDSDLTGAHLFDVAPTILATFDLPTGEGMDGAVLPVVEPVGATTYPEFDEDPRQSTAGESVEERLSDLGYIE